MSEQIAEQISAKVAVVHGQVLLKPTELTSAWTGAGSLAAAAARRPALLGSRNMAAMLGETRYMLPKMLADWQVQIPTGILAVLTYLLLVRLVLELLFVAGSRARVVRALVSVTNPVVRAVGAITPRVVPGALLTACAVFWLLTARIVLVQLTALMAMLHHGPR